MAGDNKELWDAIVGVVGSDLDAVNWVYYNTLEWAGRWYGDPDYLPFTEPAVSVAEYPVLAAAVRGMVARSGDLDPGANAEPAVAAVVASVVGWKPGYLAEKRITDLDSDAEMEESFDSVYADTSYGVEGEFAANPF